MFRFSRNMLVIVCIFWFWIRVKIINLFFIILSIKMIEYRVICMYLFWLNLGCLFMVLL